MSNFPLYPELPKVGQEEAQQLIDKFKAQLKKAAEEVICDLYCDVAMYIESDTWSNLRNQIMDGYKNYNNRKIQAAYDFKKIRAEIYKEYREDIVNDLNQDMLKEIEELKQDLERERERRRNETRLL